MPEKNGLDSESDEKNFTPEEQKELRGAEKPNPIFECRFCYCTEYIRTAVGYECCDCSLQFGDIAKFSNRKQVGQ